MQGPDLVIRQSKESLDSMGEWCQEHHAASGMLVVYYPVNLLEECFLL